MKYLLVLLMVTGCTTTQIYNRNPLSDEILRVRKDYPEKLTNAWCKDFDKDNKCINLEIISYDMNDAEFRSKLISFRFLCKIADKRFRICKDRPGFCRFETECIKHNFLGMFGCNKYKETYIPASEHQYLLDANTTCRK